MQDDVYVVIGVKGDDPPEAVALGVFDEESQARERKERVGQASRQHRVESLERSRLIRGDVLAWYTEQLPMIQQVTSQEKFPHRCELHKWAELLQGGDGFFIDDSKLSLFTTPARALDLTSPPPARTRVEWAHEFPCFDDFEISIQRIKMGKLDGKAEFV